MRSQKDLDTIQKTLLKLHKTAPMMENMEQTLSFDKQNQAIIHMPYKPEFNNGLGGIHGGTFATLMDNVGWFAVAIHFDTWISTVDMTLQFIAPAKEEGLKAIGRLVHKGHRISFAEMEVLSESGKLLAKGTATFTATQVSFPKLEE